MMIGFCTLDTVNEQFATELAERFGDTLRPVYPKDGPPDGQFEAVIYDLDHWPADGRGEVLTELRRQAPEHPVAVCSYNLDEEQVKLLSVRGVAVFPRLGEEVFEALRPPK